MIIHRIHRYCSSDTQGGRTVIWDWGDVLLA
ncbi:hypothetical protein PLANTIT3_30257 [Plantibacter sp. T3]|nr:hypothetical protein PLANTIT3_30257 [Plantibacter sp. T3]